MLPTLLRYRDLKERQIVPNRQTLSNWVKKGDFPAGRKIGPNSRAWTVDEIAAWYDSKPSAKPAAE